MSTAFDAPPGRFRLLTAPGPAAIAAVEISGSAVPSFLDRYIRLSTPATRARFETKAIHRASLLDQSGTPIDDILLIVDRPGPDWIIQLHVHGNPALVGQCSDICRQAGFMPPTGTAPLADIAVPFALALDGLDAVAESLVPQILTFTGVRWLLSQPSRLRRLYANLVGRELTVGDRQELQAAADRFEYFSWFARPLRVVLVGPPNAGKSTLLNALADQPISLVSPIPGTTRDWVEAPSQALGYPVTWIDTAGLRSDVDALETAGIAQTRRVLATADVAILVFDAADPQMNIARFLADYPDLDPLVVAQNKSDLIDPSRHVSESLAPPERARTISISATTGKGVPELVKRVLTETRPAMTDLLCPAAFTEIQAHQFRDWAGSNAVNIL